MPELPEVQTIVDDLNKKIKGLTITDVWTDWPKYFRRSSGGFSAKGGPASGWEGFKKEIKNKKIEKVWRIGKNIIFSLRGNKDMLIHQKMTGHVLVGKWKFSDKKWISAEKGYLAEKVNGYIHIMFWFSNGAMMALSDLRKFAKILIFDDKDLKNSKDVKDIGPDPLLPSFNFGQFKVLIKKKRGPIKKVLMDQNVISGIGNIYADEILFVSEIHPLIKTESLNDKKLRKIFESIKKILKKAIKLRGTSTSDYRDTAGKKGGYGDVRLVYQKEGKQCHNKCGSAIKRIKIGSRSAHFCPNCQKI